MSDELIAQLGSANPKTRAEATEALVQIGLPAVEALINALSSQSFWARAEAATALGKIGDKRAVDPLIKALADSNADVRLQAVTALILLGDNSASESISPLIADRNPKIRTAAINYLGKTGNPSAIRLIVEAADTETPSQLADALSEIGTPAVEPLLGMLDTATPKQQLVVVEALGLLGDARAIDPLTRLLKTSKGALQTTAIYALSRIGGQQVLSVLLEAFQTPGNPELVILQALINARAINRRIMEALIQQLDSDQRSNRLRAAQFLQRSRDPFAREVLKADAAQIEQDRQDDQRERNEYHSSSHVPPPTPRTHPRAPLPSPSEPAPPQPAPRPQSPGSPPRQEQSQQSAPPPPYEIEPEPAPPPPPPPPQEAPKPAPISPPADLDDLLQDSEEASRSREKPEMPHPASVIPPANAPYQPAPSMPPLPTLAQPTRSKPGSAIGDILTAPVAVVGAGAELAKEALFGKAEIPTEPPHFSAFYPETVQPGNPYALMVFAHLESVFKKVEEIAAGYAGMMGGTPKSGTVASAVQVEIGKLITLVPQFDLLKFNPAEQVITWNPPYQSATFLFTTPAALTTDLTGRVLVYHGPLIIGEIPVTMKLVQTPTAAAIKKVGEFQRFDPMFASYSHQDTPVMEYFRRARENTGVKMLVDIYDLRSGDHWNARLLQMIDESAIFQLFWSQGSATSKYCRQEWEYALKFADQRPRFIQPVWWEIPMPPPPPELGHLHFQKVTLPSLTKMQMGVAKIRGIFKR